MGHSGGGHIDFFDRFADCLLRGPLRLGHGFAHARRRFRLFGIDHHVLDLRGVHFHFFRLGSGHHGAGFANGVALAFGALLCGVLVADTAFGHARHHFDFTFAGLDATRMVVFAGLAVCLDSV